MLPKIAPIDKKENIRSASALVRPVDAMILHADIQEREKESIIRQIYIYT